MSSLDTDPAWLRGLSPAAAPTAQPNGGGGGHARDPWDLPPRLRRHEDADPVAEVVAPSATLVSACVSALFATVAYAQSLRGENLKPRPLTTWTQDVAPAERMDRVQASAVLDEIRGL